MEQCNIMRLYFPVLSREYLAWSHTRKKAGGGYLKYRIRILMFLSLNLSSSFVRLEKNKLAFLARFHEM